MSGVGAAGAEVLGAILDGLDGSIVYVDSDHVVRYLNRRARERYGRRGLSELEGRSVFDFHRPESCDKIRLLYGRLAAGEDRIVTRDAPSPERITVVAVRDAGGELSGYFELIETLSGS